MNSKTKIKPFRALVLSLVSAAIVIGPMQANAFPLAQSPLNMVGSKANVLIIMDNSNSMDEDATGAAVGSANATSKSEIARGVVRSLITTYTGKINLGLMAYKQNNLDSRHIHNSPYDLSYNPADYNPAFTGARDSTTKRFRLPNVSSPGNFLYYNVALPFYSAGNDGNAFCYSRDANAFVANAGSPQYRCFGTKTGTNNNLPAVQGNTGQEAALGYAALKGSYNFSPTDSDLAQGILSFGKRMAWNWVGRAWLAEASPGRGYLHTPIKPLDTAHATLLTNKLKCNVPGAGAPCDTTGGGDPKQGGLKNGGHTPIEGTLLTAKDYLGGGWNVASEGYTASCYPLPNSCGKNFVILLTDGLPSTDRNGTSLSNPAAAITAAAAAAATLKLSNIETYVVGFALPYGTDPHTLDALASNGGTGAAYSATDSAGLTSVFNTIFSDIIAKTGSSSAIATNSTSLNTNSKIYQARFSSADWTGQLLSITINTDGSIASAPNWDAGALLTANGSSGRNIVTWNGGGKAFTWANLSTAQQTQLNAVAPAAADGRGSERVNYFRGVRSSEGNLSTNLRLRTGLLGSIINSNPKYVGAPSGGHPDADYLTFSRTYDERAPLIYVGSSDGMLHAFNASTGAEKFAYIPSQMFPNLSKLTSQSYTHRYMVDGSPAVADAKVSSSWKTMLVSGTGAGSQSVFALDVTNPTNLTEANAASIAQWEFSDANDVNLGNVMGEPRIVKMNNDKWAVVFGNGVNNSDADGYASTTGRGAVFVLFLDRTAGSSTWTLGTHYLRLDVPAGTVASPNGIVSVATADDNRDGKVDYIYGGDLYGNLWKFNVSSATQSSWALGNGGNALFTAKDPSAVVQQISSGTIEVIKHPDGGRMILFGTGKYMESADVSNMQVQSFYGIRDTDVNATYTRANLQAQTILAQSSSGGFAWRQTSDAAVDYATKKGWYMDMKFGTANGEKIVYKPITRGTRVIFTTLIPSTAVCDAGGTSWLMEIDAINGARLTESPFDVNGDGRFTSADMLNFGATGTTYVSGRSSTIGITPYPTVIADPTSTNREYKILSGWGLLVFSAISDGTKS